jgi:hypothetical protein
MFPQIFSEGVTKDDIKHSFGPGSRKKRAILLDYKKDSLPEKQRKERNTMHDLLPDGEDVRRAVKWVSANIEENPDQAVGPLVQEAIFRFDLSPRDADFLLGFFRGRKEREEA